MFRSFTAASIAALFALPALACDGFDIHDAYARSSTPMSQSGAAFMVIHNHGDTDCHIIGASSEIAARTELHTHFEDDQGVMHMIHVEEGFPLPADVELILDRGGHHVMFMGLNQTLAQGDVIDVTFEFADGSEQAVEIPVDLERQPDAHDHSHDHSHEH